MCLKCVPPRAAAGSARAAHRPYYGYGRRNYGSNGLSGMLNGTGWLKNGCDGRLAYYPKNFTLCSIFLAFERFY
jgi:hypothetical protein